MVKFRIIELLISIQVDIEKKIDLYKIVYTVVNFIVCSSFCQSWECKKYAHSLCKMNPLKFTKYKNVRFYESLLEVLLPLKIISL